MCGDVGDWVMMLGQTPHNTPPDSSLGEITVSMPAILRIHLPP